MWYMLQLVYASTGKPVLGWLLHSSFYVVQLSQFSHLLLIIINKGQVALQPKIFLFPDNAKFHAFITKGTISLCCAI